ncbi:peptide ABC transporter substrate-binding protein [Thermotoga sp. 38H-to]|nr:peptide ABC transporter substrate-binding protein [Thermotoga sp. 38H-to]
MCEPNSSRGCGSMRRYLFVLLVSFIAVMLLASELPPLAQYNLSDYEKLTGKKITKFNEAPVLAELVKQGKLPPVRERLPEDPIVLVPWENIGKYGGTWNRAWTGPTDRPQADRFMLESAMVFDPRGKELYPNILEKIEMSSDGKEFICTLKKGLKWSDGVPVTTEDVRFWYEDVLLNEELVPTFPRDLMAGGKPMKLEIIDDYTYRIIFEEPYPLFKYLYASRKGSWGTRGIMLPAHYLKQFHPKYVPLEELQKMAKEAGYDNWSDYFWSLGDHNAHISNPDLPILAAWKLKEITDSKLVIERNPFYWKIDPTGNQLPYIDEIVFWTVQDRQMILLKAMSGEIDMQARHLSLEDYTLLATNAQKGGYRIIKWKLARGSDVTLWLNQNVKDPVLRELFQNIKFRQALSLAINREEINSLVYYGLCEPRQASFVSGVKFYDPEWETKWVEYDPETSNKLLDEIGLTKRDAEGYRLRPDGQPLILTIEYPTGVFGAWDKTLEMIAQYFQKIGIKVNLKPEERSLYGTRCSGGEPEIGVWFFDRNKYPMLDPGRLLGTVTDGPWAPLYGQWYNSGGKGGEEPPEGSDIRKIYELWEKVKMTVDEEERDKLFREIVNIHKKNIWYIGTVGEPIWPVVVKTYFKNVPDSPDFVWENEGDGQHAEQYYMDK